jgi:hypothetical protein
LLERGLSRYQETQQLTQADRKTLEQRYQQVIDDLEKAKSELAENERSPELYQALWQSYRDLALLPVRFQQGTDPAQGVVPRNMQLMKKALAVFAEGKARYPDAPMLGTEADAKLQADLKELESVYVANVQRQWDELNESGYRKLDDIRNRQ